MARSRPSTQSELVEGISLWWYLAALVPILLIAAISFMGWLPIFGFMIALFLFIFWLFSFLFTAALKISAARKAKK
jgi:hypothetical protein